MDYYTKLQIKLNKEETIAIDVNVAFERDECDSSIWICLLERLELLRYSSLCSAQSRYLHTRFIIVCKRHHAARNIHAEDNQRLISGGRFSRSASRRGQSGRGRGLDQEGHILLTRLLPVRTLDCLRRVAKLALPILHD